MEKALLTLRDVERITGLARSTLYRRLSEGRLRGIQLDNGQWRIPSGEVRKILGGNYAVDPASGGV